MSYVDLEEFNALKAAYAETVELLAKALGRIAELENAVFMCDPEGDVIRDQEDTPILSPGLQQTAQRTEIERPVIPSKNVTEIRADFLIDYILNKTHLIPKAESFFANVKAWVVNSKEFRYFVNNELPEEYKPDTRNLRKLKKDIFETVESRFNLRNSDKQGIFVDKADHGRNELRLIYTRQLNAQEEEDMLVRMGVIKQPSLNVTT